MKPVLGVVLPMSMEAGFILGWSGWQRWGGQKIQRKSMDPDMDLLCVRSGIGAENATAAACWLADHGATALIVVGVSGGLDPVLRAGDLIIPEIIIEEPDVSEWNKDKRVIDVSIADLLSNLLISQGITVHRGMLVTSPNPILTPREKSAVFIKYGARSIDMESASVCRVAHDQNLPFLVIRSVIDTATTDIPLKLFQSVNAKGSLRWPFLLIRLLFNPFLLPRLMRFSSDFFHALVILKTTWRLMIRHRLLHRFARGEGTHCTP